MPGRYDIWNMIRKFGPFAVILGYVALYYTQKSNGLAQIIPDIQNLNLQRLSTKWQNFAIAIVAGIGLSVLHKLRLPNAFKVLITIALYFLIGWEIASAIDPPTVTRSGASVKYVSPSQYNPYSLTG
jgi:hypothetical protein